jgi:predicted nucleotidyltransferase
MKNISNSFREQVVSAFFHDEKKVGIDLRLHTVEEFGSSVFGGCSSFFQSDLDLLVIGLMNRDDFFDGFVTHFQDCD